MALRDWSARQIGQLWLLGLALETVLAAGLYVTGSLSEPPEPPIFRAMRAHDDSVRGGLLPPPHEVTPAERAAFEAMLRDSLGITVRHAGDTIVVEGPPEFHRAAERVARGIGSAARTAAVIAALVFLPIPATLLLTTLCWLVASRLRSRPGPLAPGP